MKYFFSSRFLVLLFMLMPLLAMAGTPVLTLQATTTSASVDVTAFVDQVEIINAATGGVVVSAVPNSSFEVSNTLGNSGYSYQPTGAAWAFVSNSGIVANGSPFSSPAAPAGTRAAFLQTNGGAAGSLSQTLPTLPAGTYRIRLQLAQRGTSPANQGVRILFDGAVVGVSTPANDGAYHSYTSPAFAYESVLRFEATGSPSVPGADVVAFLDQLAVVDLATSTATALVNASFETTGSLGAGSSAYAPTSTGWTFGGNGGLATNGSALGNPAAPDGTHTAFLQTLSAGGSGTMQQLLPVLPAGNYQLRLQAAQRAGSPADQGVRVLLDGVVLTTLTPAAGSFQPYAVSLSPAPVITGITPTMGTAGTSVTIAGAYLGGAIGLSLNGVAVPLENITYNSASSLTFTVPAGATSGPLIVTTPSAASAASSQLFTVCQLTAAVQNVTLVLPLNGTGTVLASAFDAGSTSSCAPVTVTIRKGGVVFGSVLEGRTLTLTAPAGLPFTAVDFASYGNPTGSAGNYVRGTCHAAGSQNKAETSLLGRTGAVSLAATNANFGGDPCNGTAKNLAVRAYFGTGAAATASLSYTCTELGPQPVLVTLTDANGSTTTLSATVTVTMPTTTVTGLSPQPAAPGTTVSVTGTNLDQASSLTVNGATAAINNQTATGFTFVVPATATPVGTLVLGLSCARTLTQAFSTGVPGITSFAPLAGPVGTSVTITGDNLANATGLTLNGVAVPPAGITANTGTSLTFTVPMGATSGPLVVTTAGGSAASSQSFTFIAAPAISSFTPTSGVYGTSLDLLGSNLTGATAITFSGSSANVVTTGFVVAADGSRITGIRVPAGAATGPLTVATPGGSAASSATFTVQPFPTLLTLSPQLALAGQVLTLTGTNLSGATTINFTGRAGTVVTTGFAVNAAGTQITGIVVPVGAQSGPLTVTTPLGTSVGILFARARTLAAGTWHTLSVRPDGTLWAWGDNRSGQLGDGTTSARATPVQVGTATNWISVAAGDSHSAAIRADGTLWAWGENDGRVGDGSTSRRLAPVQVGTATNWTSVAAGNTHTLAVRADGTLWAWGTNGVGQLGDGTMSAHATPVQVGTATNWTSVAADLLTSMGLKADGTLWAWGDNRYGQLGDGTTSARSTPAQVGTATNWTGMAAGEYCSAAIRADGTLWAWGQNNYGQLGLGHTANQSAPTQVGSASTWVSVSLKQTHTVALQVNGSLWAWGTNMAGALGDGTTTDHLIPGPVGTLTSWTSAVAGAFHTAGEQSCRKVWAWGFNYYGQVGDGTTTQRTTPVQVYNPVQLLSFAPASAPAGATVTVTGTSLGSLTALTVNGALVPPASISNVTDTGFRFVVPTAAAATGTTTLVTDCGTATSSGFSVLPCLTVQSQPQTLPLAANGTGRLAASAFDAGSTSVCGPITFSARKGGIVYGTAADGYNLTLTAPAGTRFTAVEFASFGNPTGSNGTYAQGSCHAVFSRSTVEGYLLGQTGSVSIPAYYSVFAFSDPCPGVAKRLAVRAVYMADTAVANLNFSCADVGTTPLILTATDINGLTVSSATSVSVLAPPTATLASLSPQPAGPGTTVTATGTNLSGASTITVNGATASVSNATATGFTFVVPATATPTGTAVLSLPCGQTFTQPFVTGVPVITSFTPTSGVQGTSVTITGLDLANATGLSLNGVAVPLGNITANTGTSLTFTVPAGATSGVLVVTSAYGPSPASGQALVILDAPVITAITPASALTGASISLTGTNLLGVSAVTFAGSGGTAVPVTTGFVVNATGTSITGIVVPLAAATGPLIVTSPAGSSAANGPVFTLLPKAILTSVSPQVATPGQVLTFTGLRLDGATAITFAGAAGVKVVTTGFTVNAAGTQLTGVVVPPGAQSGPVTVTTPLGTSVGILFVRARTLVAGQLHTLAVREDGSLWWWGAYEYDLFTPVNNPLPFQTRVGTSNGWRSVTADYHSVGIQADGTLWVWGSDIYRALGPTGGGALVPTQVGTATNWVSAAAGAGHTLALQADGTLWAWGVGSQVGLGNATGQPLPTQVGTATDWASVAAGAWHSAAVRADGTLWTWGQNTYNQLGLGTPTNTPVTVPTQVSTATNWVGVAAGEFHTVAVRADGTLWGWGYPGRTGDGTMNFRPTPVQVGTATDWVSVAAGPYHSVGLRADGTLWAWGDGPAMGSASTAPVQVGTATTWKSASGGRGFTVGEQGCREVWAWGANNVGQLGNGTTNYQATPTRVYTPVSLLGFTPASAAAGATVTVTGTRLGSLTRLTVNGAAVPMTSISNLTDTGFRFIVPTAAAVSGTITLVTDCGTVTSTGFAVLPCVVPAVQSATLTLGATGTASIAATAFDAGSTSTCGPISVTARKAGVVYGSVTEGNTLTLTAPPGTRFTAVEFASYGTPTGSNGQYTQGSCHFTHSQAFAEAYLLGRTGSVDILAINSSFALFSADDCPGISKTLAIRAIYTADAPAATLDYNCNDLGARTVLLTITDVNGATTNLTTTLNVLPPLAATITGLSPQPAAPGTTVTATGTNLGGASAITVNGAAASVSNVTATGFTFVVPAAATPTGNVVMSLPCIQVVTQAFSTGVPGITSLAPLTGPVGTSVTLTGVNLANITSLTLNGVAVPSGNITANTGTSLTFTVPAGATSGTVVVSSAGGTSAASSQVFYVEPVLTAVAPSSALPGASISLTGTNLGGTTAITFTYGGMGTYVVTAGFVVNATGTSITGIVVPAGAVTGPLTVTAAGGTSPANGPVLTILSFPTLTGLTPRVGLPGAVLTLSGTNLSGATTITFTGSAGTKVVTTGFAVNAAGTQITGVVVPAGAQSGLVTVTTPMGTSVVDALVFSRAKTVAAGAAHAVTVQEDGTLWTWGQNSQGQLGLGTTTNTNSPTQVGTAATWVSVAAGDAFTLAVRADGTLWAWGQNSQGQLGLGSTTNQTAPTQVGTSTTWMSVAAGNAHALAVRTDGTLWAWGQNSQGQLGLNNTANQTTPTQVGTATTWASVAAGAAHTVAVQTNGTLWAWGDNSYGTLGQGTTGGSLNMPTQVGTASTWVSAAGGLSHTLAERADGSLWAWGRNDQGQLGLGSSADSSVPLRVGGSTEWLSVAAGASHSGAIRTDGMRWSWGLNSQGQLGNNTTTATTSPVLADISTEWTSLAAGAAFMAGEQRCRAVWTWGSNGSGQLGDGSPNSSLIPVVGLNPARLLSFTPTQALPGATVTVTGTRLLGLTGLSVNGTTVPLSDISNLTDTGFRFVVPVGVAPIGISTATVGCGTASSRAFTVPPTITSFTPATGPVGTSVTIAGTNLAGATAVYFNGVAQRVIISNTPTALTVAVPNGATSGPLTVVAASGTSMPSSQSFTVCQLVVVVQTPTLALATNGTGSIAATAFNNGSTMTCSNVAPTATVRRGSIVYGAVSEGGTLTLTAPAGSMFLSVDFASYGNPTGSNGAYERGSCHAPTSQSVVEKALLYRTGTVSIPVTSAKFGGDPCPGTVKKLAVRVTYAPAGRLYGFVAQNDLFNLKAPDGYVFTAVDFASYGTPTSALASYDYVITPGCHASNSQSVVEQAVLGRNQSLSFVVNNFTFPGLACGLHDYLQYSIIYSIPESQPSLDFTCADVGVQPVLLTLTDGGGLSTTVAASVNVLPPPAATITSLSPQPAMPGTVVTATGTNLSGATSLTINGTAATINNLTDSGFTFVVPGNGNSTNGLVLSRCSQTLTQPFQQGITTFSPLSGPVGTSVTLTGTKLGGVTSLTLNGAVVPPNHITANSATSLTFTVPVGATSGPIAVTTAAGTSAPSSQLFTVCQVMAAVQSVAVPLGASGLATVAASAFDNGSTTSCQPAVTATARKGGVAYGMVSEGSTLTLTAPAGYTFTAVDFASYGTPTGSAGSTGSYSLGGCYASSSRSVVEAALLGHTGTVSIAATNANFGSDPCGGTAKSLAVRAYYTSTSDPSGTAATATLSYSCAELGTQPVLLTLTDAAGGSTTVGTSATVSSPAATSLTWTGATSNDWADCANWSYGRVPTAATDVLIPAGLARYPSLTSGTSPVKDISVELGASLTTSAGATLQVAGNWNVNGTTTLAGPVAFVGSGPQTLGGLSNTTFTTLSVNKPLGVLTLQRAVSVTSSLALSSGLLNTDAYDLTTTGATLTETATSYVAGTVVSAAILNSPGVRYSFGGLGLALTPDASTGNLPGLTVVRRTTGRVLTGAGLLRGIQRSYDIQAAATSGMNVTLEFGYRDGELAVPSLENTLSLVRSSTGSAGPWQEVPVSSRDVSLNTVTATGVTHFSVWTLGESSAPLPVELTRFTATPVADQTAVLLAWATASEKNSSRFEVQRSADGVRFNVVGEVAAAGIATSAHSYTLQDVNLPAGASLLYYRLRQIDQDGTFTYSPVRSVSLKTPGLLTLFPNPAHATVTLSGAEPGRLVEVYDALGRLVATATAAPDGTAAILLPQGLGQGVYVVRTGGKALRLTVE